MLIGELSARSGASARSLRHYEVLGLLHAERGSNGYRSYDDGSVELVRTIRLMFEMGLSRSLVREVLPCAMGSHEEVDRVALRGTIEGLRDRLAAQIADLSRTHDAIDAFLTSPESDPAGGGFVAGVTELTAEVAATR